MTTTPNPFPPHSSNAAPERANAAGPAPHGGAAPTPLALAVAVGLLGSTAIAGTTSDDADGRAVTLDALEVKVSTATRSERLLSEVPIRTEVLGREDIALRAALDLTQAVELINGLRVESNCQNCNTTEVQLLGLPGAYNQLLFDGTPLLSTLGGVYGLEQIPAAFINRIEVVKGGGSSLYGPGAVAGVINLIPDRPQAPGGFMRIGLDMQRGEPLRYADARIDTLAPGKRLGISFVAQAADGDAIDFNGDGYSEITRKSQRVVGAQAWHVLSDRSTLRANLQLTREDRRGGNRLDQPEYLSNIAESLETDYARGGLRFEQVVNDDLDISLGYAFAFIRRDSFYGGLGDVATSPDDPAFDPVELDPTIPGSAASVSFDQYGRTRNPLHFVDSQFNWTRGAHALAFGLQYKRERVEDLSRNARGETLATLGDERFSNLGLYVQDEWTVSEALDLVSGLRIDKASVLDDPILSPRVALAFSASDRLKLRAAVSTGFRAPDVFSEDLHIETLGAAPIRIRNDAGLKEERAVTGMLGLEWRSNPSSPAWQWDFTASLTDLRDSFVVGEVQTDSDGSLFQVRSNASGSSVAGVEGNLAWQPAASLKLNAGVAWYRTRYDEPQVVFDDQEEGGGTVLATRDYLKTPEWTGLMQATWSPGDRADAFLALRYTGRMLALNNNTATLNRTPEFWGVDVGGTLHLHGDSTGGWDLSLGVRNLFDDRQEDLEFGPNRDSDYVYGPRAGRTVYANLRYAF